MDSKEDTKSGKVAPPPPVASAVAPPHPHAGESRSKPAEQGHAGGFNPKSSHLFLEVGVAIAAVVGLALLVILLGGRIAAWATPLVPISVDQQIGELAQKQFELTAETCSNPEPLNYVETLARPLLDQVQGAPFDFHFRVADTEEINAFALPGGYVTVNFGLLKAAESGEEVAGVIAHEIQHALRRHGTKRMLRQIGSRSLLFLVLGDIDVLGVASLASQLGALSYDRDEESEADRLGVELLLSARIDPRGLASFFERLSRDSIQPPEILSTHPDPGERASLVEKAGQAGKFQVLAKPTGLSCHEHWH